VVGEPGGDCWAKDQTRTIVIPTKARLTRPRKFLRKESI